MHFCTDDQCTPAHYAGANGHVRCFQCLLEHGADISLKNNSGENPLDVARKHGKPHAISKAGECIILWTQQPSMRRWLLQIVKVPSYLFISVHTCI